MAPKIRFHLGDAIRYLRKHRGWSIEDLAAKADLNKATISTIERGANYRGDTVAQIAQAFGFQTVEDLLHEAGASGATESDAYKAKLLSGWARLAAVDYDAAIREWERIVAALVERRAAHDEVAVLRDVVAEREALVAQSAAVLAEREAAVQQLRREVELLQQSKPRQRKAR